MIKELTQNDDEFYRIMARYLGDKGFIKELDNQLYTNEKMVWFLCFRDNVLRGFASLELSNKNKLDNVYVFEPYRNNGVCQEIIKHIIEKENEDIYLITRNLIAKHVYEKFGFKEIQQNGRYFKMRRCVNE